MASESTSKPEELNARGSSIGRNESGTVTGSSVWNLCSIPSDSHAVDLRDITPSISPVFTDDQVRELSGQTGDLDVLGDNFLPHDTFKRIAEVLSPEQTNLLISTCSTLCPESEVLSYTDPVLGALGQYPSPLKHGNDPMLNPPAEISENMDPLIGNLAEKEKSNAMNSKQLATSTTTTTVVSSSSGSITSASAEKDENSDGQKTEQSKEKGNEDPVKETDTEVKGSKDKKKSETVKSTYSLRSSPRKQVKIQENDVSPGRNSRQNCKKESPTEVERRKSPRGSQKQQQPEKDETALSVKGEKRGRGGGRRKKGTTESEAVNSQDESDKKEDEGMSLRRSSRIQRHGQETSPVILSPRKGKAGRKKAEVSSEEENKIKVEEKTEIHGRENTEEHSEVEVIKSPEVKEEEEVKAVEGADKDNDLPKEEKKASIEEEEKEEKEKSAVLLKEVQELKPINEKVKEILTEILDLDKEICKASKNNDHDESKAVAEEEATVKDVETKVEEVKDSSEEGKEQTQKKKTERKKVSKKDLQPSRRSNRISESIQKREIEVAVKKAQEEMLKQIEEEERQEREEEERKRRDEEERKRREEEEERKRREEEEIKKKEEEQKQKEEEERKMKEEIAKKEKELKEKEKEKEESKKRAGIKKENEKDLEKPRKEIKKAASDHHKIKEKSGDHKIKDKSEKVHAKVTDDKILKSPSQKKKQHANQEKSEEKKDGTSLFAVGLDHEVYSKVKHKRHSSEEDKPARIKRSKTSEHSKDDHHAEEGSSETSVKTKDAKGQLKEDVSSSDEERDSEEEIMEDDSDYDPEYDPERLWCICRKPHGNRFMICCDSCEEWLHGDCVSITKEIGKEMEKNGIEYVCPRCVIAKKKLREQGGGDAVAKDPSKQSSDTTGVLKRPRRRRRLKMPIEPGERRHHRHSADSTSKAGKKEGRGHEKRSRDSGQKDSSDIKRRNSDQSSYKIPKKVRTTPTPASFASRIQRKCINTGCQNHAEHHSVYCSDACIAKHAEESINLLNEERKKRIGHTSHPSKPTTSPTSSINVPMPWESPHSTAAPTSPQIKERVAVIERTTGRVIAGVAAPAEQDLVHWLQRHPTFEVIKPSVTKEVKRKDKKEEERAIRDNVKRSLREILNSRLREAPELKLTSDDIVKFSINIEEDLYKLFGDAGPRYKSKYRSLAFNLKDFRNKVLFHHVLSGEVPTDKLVAMTAEQLANQELARWRERETKHTLEMIKQNQEDINPTKGHIKKTHKGEIELDEDEDLSTLEVHAVNQQSKEKSEVAEPDSNTSPGPLLIDTTDQHRIHLFDLNCRICTGKIQPPGEPPRQEDMLMLVSTTTPIQALAESSVPSPPPITMDVASVSSTDSFPMGSVSPPPTIKPVRRDKPVWKGFVMMQSVAKFGTNAYRVSGPCDDLLQLLPDTLHLQGRIGFEQVWDYIYQLRNSTTRDVSVIRYEASSDEEKTSYVSLYSYFYSRKRCGVVNNCYTGVKDMYLMPLASHSPIPTELLPFDGPGLEEPRPHMLLGIIVRNKAHFKRPRPIHHKSSSPQPKRRHSNISKSSDESQPKDSPPPEIEDIVFQYAHNKKSTSESKPTLSPSSGSSGHSSTLDSPSVVTPSVAAKSETSLESTAQKTQKEELHDLEARAKQYIASALQSNNETADKDSTKTEETKPNDDDDKPYDPEEDFDLDLELEKPIDEKKNPPEKTPLGTTGEGASKPEEVSSTAGLSTALKGASDSKPGQDSVQKLLSNPLSGLPSQVSSIPLITPVSSAASTTTASSIPSLPPSIFMPITTTSTSSGPALIGPNKPLGTQPVTLPAADLAGIVKLIGATLKQTNVPGQAPTSDTQNPQTSTLQSVATTLIKDPKPDTSKGTSVPHEDPQFRGSTSEARPETSYNSLPEGSRRPAGPHHDEAPAHRERTSQGGSFSATDRQRIDRERLEWRERRYSRDGPRDHRGPRDVGSYEDRWRDQRDSRGGPVRRPSGDRYHSQGEPYGPHRGENQDRGRYIPHHRDDRRGDRREDRRNEPRNSDRWRERWRR